jgi:hypothetical protein
MTKQTQVLLGVAVLAGVGYFLFMQNKKKSSFASFMEDDFMSDPVKMVEKCKGDTGTDSEGRYICCKPGFRSKQTSGIPCDQVGKGAVEELAF